MPIAPTYPGVYVEELPSGVHTITGVATSITAFIGRALRGPTDRPLLVQSFAEFDRTFGGLWARSPLSYAVQHFFLNGGRDALIARVHNGAAAARVDLGAAGFRLVASSEGAWGNNLRIRIDHDTRPTEPGETANSLFNLSVRDADGTVERFVNLSFESDHPRFVTHVLNLESQFLRVDGTPAARPDASGAPPANADPLVDNASSTPLTLGGDGDPIGPNQVTDPALQAQKRGLWLLEQADLFNLLCIPPFTSEVDVPAAVWATAQQYCATRRAMLLVDTPSGWTSADTARTQIDTLITDRGTNGAVFFPWIRVADPLRENRLSTFAPSGAVAGVFARTDAERGVWKAPAGIDATLIGVDDLSVGLTDNENGQLNPLAINCLRAFPVIGRVVWGSRTLRGADRLASEWKYIPVRRMALYIEESLYRGTQWVVFEPNDEPLWAQIRLNVGAFMHDLFRQGAFQGRTPREAYFVRCSSETTTQSDIDHGIVNILVGFAPLQPAEFVMIKIQQIREQVEA
jgi:phage tail sheath protein FI